MSSPRPPPWVHFLAALLQARTENTAFILKESSFWTQGVLLLGSKLPTVPPSLPFSLTSSHPTACHKSPRARRAIHIDELGLWVSDMKEIPPEPAPCKLCSYEADGALSKQRAQSGTPPERGWGCRETFFLAFRCLLLSAWFCNNRLQGWNAFTPATGFAPRSLLMGKKKKNHHLSKDKNVYNLSFENIASLGQLVCSVFAAMRHPPLWQSSSEFMLHGISSLIWLRNKTAQDAQEFLDVFLTSDTD